MKQLIKKKTLKMIFWEENLLFFCQLIKSLFSSNKTWIYTNENFTIKCIQSVKTQNAKEKIPIRVNIEKSE